MSATYTSNEKCEKEAVNISGLFRGCFRGCEEITCRAGTIMKIAGGKLRAFAFMPMSLLKEYLDILFKVSGDHPDMHFDLSYVGDYGKDIWEWA
jgi:hypothetical protein